MIGLFGLGLRKILGSMKRRSLQRVMPVLVVRVCTFAIKMVYEMGRCSAGYHRLTMRVLVWRWKGWQRWL